MVLAREHSLKNFLKNCQVYEDVLQLWTVFAVYKTWTYNRKKFQYFILKPADNFDFKAHRKKKLHIIE